MKTMVKSWMLDEFRQTNCKAKTCEECDKYQICFLPAFFDNVGMTEGTDIEIAIKVLETNGFHVTDANEERYTADGTRYVVDEKGIKPTGALLLRVVPVTPSIREGGDYGE